MKHLLSLGVLLGSTAMPHVALAQDGGSAASAEQAAPMGADEIIVTAQKKAERIEDVPVAMTVVAGETLERAGITKFNDIGQIAAGAQIGRGGVSNQPAIRGISTLTSGPGFENNIAVFVDGFYQNDAVSINADLVNLASVQVLKGPQGTLYGRNAMGGALVFETLAPSSEFTASGQASYGRFDDKRIQGYVSAPISDKIGFSVAAGHRHTENYIRDIGADPVSKDDDYAASPVVSTSIRTKLQFDPTEDLSITLGYNHVYVSDNRSLIYTFPAYASPAVGACGARACARDTISQNSGSQGEPIISTELNDFTGVIRLDTGFGSISSYTGYAMRKARNNFDLDGSKRQIVYIETPANLPTASLFQQSVDFNVTSIDKLNLIVGGQYIRDRTPNFFQQYSGGALQVTSFTRLKAEAFAAYADATVQLGDSLFLTGGVRYTNELKGIQYNQIAGTLPAVPSVDKEKRFKAVTPRANIRYAIGDRTSIYASYSQGFRSGTFNPSPLTSPALVIATRPEKVSSYELGFKTAGGGLHFDTSVFYYKFKDLIVGATVTNPLDPTRVIVLTTNAARAVGYGADAQISYSATEDLNLRAGMAYTHARYKDFKNAVGTGVNAANTLNISAQTQDWSGQQLARAPSFVANAGFDYTFDAIGGRLLIAGNGSYTTSYVVRDPSLFGPLAPAAIANKQRYRTGPYAVVNARVAWTDPSGHYTIGAYANNFTNTRFKLANQGTAFGDVVQYSEPATYGVQIGFKY